MHHRNVNQAVLHGRARGDKGVIAVLCRIAACDDKGFLLHPHAVDVDDVFLRLVLDILGQGGLDVGDEAACALVGELVAHRGVKSHTAGAEERLAVHGAVVKLAHHAVVEHLQGPVGVHRDAQVACQAVARAARHNGQRCGCAAQGAAHLVDGTVTANGNHDVDAVLDSLFGDFMGMAGVFGGHDAHFMAVGIHDRVDEPRNLVLVTGPRHGVDDGEYVHAFLLHSLQR